LFLSSSGISEEKVLLSVEMGCHNSTSRVTTAPATHQDRIESPTSLRTSRVSQQVTRKLPAFESIEVSVATQVLTEPRQSADYSTNSKHYNLHHRLAVQEVHIRDLNARVGALENFKHEQQEHQRRLRHHYQEPKEPASPADSEDGKLVGILQEQVKSYRTTARRLTENFSERDSISVGLRQDAEAPAAGPAVTRQILPDTEELPQQLKIVEEPNEFQAQTS